MKKKLIRKPPSRTIDAYIAALPPRSRAAFRSVRAAIRKAIPDAEERISYGMPAFVAYKRHIAYIGAWKKHIGLYPPVPKAFEMQTAKYRGPKGNLQFPLEKPMPLALIKKIVRYSVKELAAKAKR